MLTIVGYTVQDDKVYFKVLAPNASEPELVELVKEDYLGIIQDGPPTTYKFLKNLDKKILDIIERRVLTIEKVDEDLAKLDDVARDVRKKLLDSGDKLLEKQALDKYKLILATITSERTDLNTRRHIIKALYQEEAKVKSRIIELSQSDK